MIQFEISQKNGYENKDKPRISRKCNTNHFKNIIRNRASESHFPLSIKERDEKTSMKETRFKIDKQAETITSLILEAWENTPSRKPSIKTKKYRGKWTEKIKTLSNQIARLTREKNYYTKKQKKENISTKTAINKGRKKLYKLLNKLKEEEKKKYYSTIEKTPPLARLGKVLENKNTELGVLIKNDGTATTKPEETLEHLADELLGKEVKKNQKKKLNNENTQMRRI